METEQIEMYLECNTGIENLAITLPNIVASLKVHVPSSQSGSNIPLKKAAGLNKVFFNA